VTRADFAEALYAFAARHGASQTSGLRSVAHNAAVGGVARSAHLFGLAADVVYDEHQALADVSDTARRLGLLLIREGDHDHLQPLDWAKS